MFGIGSTELLVILLVALIVMGPRKLPQIARSMGKAFGEFKRVSSGFKQTIDMEVQRVEREEKQTKAKKELLVDDAAPEAAAADVSPELATPPAESGTAVVSPEDSYEAEFEDQSPAAESPASTASSPSSASSSADDAKESDKA